MVMAMAIETVMTVMVTAQQAAAALTQIESMEHC